MPHVEHYCAEESTRYPYRLLIMESYRVSVELFVPKSKGFPPLKWSCLHPGERLTCSCQEIVNSQLRGLIWADNFALNILCHSLTTFQDVHRVYMDCLEGYSQTRDKVKAQRNLLFGMKEVCECDRQLKRRATQEEWDSSDDDTAMEDALIPARTPPYSVSSDAGLSLSSRYKTLPTSTKSVSMNGVFRLPPLILKLDPSQGQLNDTARAYINNNIRKVLRQRVKPVSPRQKRFNLGYVYIMATDCSPGFVKIGSSKENPYVRRKQLEECFQGIHVLANTKRPIPHAQKVEKLVHAELLSHSRWIDCSRCGKEHREWFEISAELAEQVVFRWSAWMASSPCDPDGNLNDIWSNRLQDRFIAKLVPAVDHIHSSDSWQTWTDTRRPDGASDFSSLVSIIRHERDNFSPWD